MGNAGCVSLRLPFGVGVGATALANPTLTFDPMRGLLSQFASTLGPFMTLFKIVGFAKDVSDALAAIPDCITQLSPAPLIKKLAKVVADIEELLGVLPPASVPVMLEDLLGAMITYLKGVRSQVAGLRNAGRATARLETNASSLHASHPAAAAELLGIVTDSIADTTDVLATLDSQQCAYNGLVVTIGVLCKLLGVPAPPILPCFGSASVTSAVDLLAALDEVLNALNLAIGILETIGLALGATTPVPPC